MNQEEMIKTILEFEKELWTERNEMFEAFGNTDRGTQRAITQWCVIYELIEKLKIEKP
jgi:hypothetical protein